MAVLADNLFVKKASNSNPGKITVRTIRQNHSTKSIVNKVRKSSSDSSTTAVRASVHLTWLLGISGEIFHEHVAEFLGCEVILRLGTEDLY